jgi:hypothetical protein
VETCLQGVLRSSQEWLTDVFTQSQIFVINSVLRNITQLAEMTSQLPFGKADSLSFEHYLSLIHGEISRLTPSQVVDG